LIFDIDINKKLNHFSLFSPHQPLRAPYSAPSFCFAFSLSTEGAIIDIGTNSYGNNKADEESFDFPSAFLMAYLFTVFARVFGDGALVDDRFIKPPAACEVIAIVAVACENTASEVGTKSRMAMNVDGSVFRNFI